MTSRHQLNALSQCAATVLAVSQSGWMFYSGDKARDWDGSSHGEWHMGDISKLRRGLNKESPLTEPRTIRGHLRPPAREHDNRATTAALLAQGEQRQHHSRRPRVAEPPLGVQQSGRRRPTVVAINTGRAHRRRPKASPPAAG
ncbi:unnamed protein product [Lampetra planeri]